MVGCQCRHRRPTLLVREIARYTGRQAASPRVPFRRPKGGKSRAPRQNRAGRGRVDGEAWDGTVSRAVAERVPVINSHRPPADGLRIEFAHCIHMLKRIGRLFKRVAVSTTSLLLVTYTSTPTYWKSAQRS